MGEEKVNKRKLPYWYLEGNMAKIEKELLGCVLTTKYEIAEFNAAWLESKDILLKDFLENHIHGERKSWLGEDLRIEVDAIAKRKDQLHIHIPAQVLTLKGSYDICADKLSDMAIVFGMHPYLQATETDLKNVVASMPQPLPSICTVIKKHKSKNIQKLRNQAAKVGYMLVPMEGTDE